MRPQHPIKPAALDALWFVSIAGIFTGLGYASHRWSTLDPFTRVAAIGLFIATTYVEIVLVADDEDWWDDFRGQKRNMILVPLLQLAAVGGGWRLGWWIAA